jgi:hypothetical protein
MTSREAIEQADPTFAAARGDEPLHDAVAALGAVEQGAQVVVVLGLWCSDSRRELSRFFRALDALDAPPPFEVVYIAVDRAKEAPGGEIDGLDIDRIPTFIVRRGGTELGRVIERAPAGIEGDLASLLSGARTGVITSE